MRGRGNQEGFLAGLSGSEALDFTCIILLLFVFVFRPRMNVIFVFDIQTVIFIFDLREYILVSGF